MPAKQSPERRELNQHVWTMHNRAALSGDLLSRLAQHDLMHAEDNEELYAGSPLHRHQGGGMERMGEVILDEGEGTI